MNADLAIEYKIRHSIEILDNEAGGKYAINDLKQLDLN